MKKLLSLLLAAAMLLALAVPALADEAEVEAAPESHWYDEAVKNVMEKGVMGGTDNGFAPNGAATRATVVQALYNLAGKPEALNKMAVLPDAQGKWYEDAVRWAQQNGITTGDANNRFNGDVGVTRVELALFLYRYALYREVFVTCDANLLDYVDGELVPRWAVYALQWAVSSKVINGTADGYLNPGKTATRAELAQVLTNFIAFVHPEDTTSGTATLPPMEGHTAHTHGE